MGSPPQIHLQLGHLCQCSSPGLQDLPSFPRKSAGHSSRTSKKALISTKQRPSEESKEPWRCSQRGRAEVATGEETTCRTGRRADFQERPIMIGGTWMTTRTTTGLHYDERSQHDHSRPQSTTVTLDDPDDSRLDGAFNRNETYGAQWLQLDEQR